MTETNETGDTGKSAGVSRRTVTKAMAWAVPSIAVAATVPMAAASCIPTVSLGAGSCKCPGQSGLPWAYFLRVCEGGEACESGSSTIVVTSVVSNSGVTIYTGPSAPFTNGQCVIIEGSSSNSANFLDIYYTIDGDPAPEPVRVDAPPDCDKIADPIGSCAVD